MTVKINANLNSIKTNKENIECLGKDYEHLFKKLEDKLYIEMKLYWNGNRYYEFIKDIEIYMDALKNIEFMLSEVIPSDLEMVIDTYRKRKRNNINFYKELLNKNKNKNKNEKENEDEKIY